MYDLHFEERATPGSTDETRTASCAAFSSNKGTGEPVQFIEEERPHEGQQEDAGDGSPIEQRMPDRNYHIVYPDNEASGWICCCA